MYVIIFYLPLIIGYFDYDKNMKIDILNGVGIKTSEMGWLVL